MEFIENLGNVQHHSQENIWKSTQNIYDSWSNPDCVGEYDTNVDNDPNIDVLVPLPVVNGKKMGHRSTSMNDLVVFEYENGTQKTYRAAAVGWVCEMYSKPKIQFSQRWHPPSGE